MIIVRLARGGAKKRPFYHIVVTDSRRPRDSGYLERLGYFNPAAVGGEVPIHLNRERLDYWVTQGSKLSDRVSSIVRKLDRGESFNQSDKKRRVKAKTKARVAARAAKEAEAATESDDQLTESAEVVSEEADNQMTEQAEATEPTESNDEAAAESKPSSKSSDKADT